MATSSSHQPIVEDNLEVLGENILCKNQVNVMLAKRALVGKIRSTKVKNVKAAKEIIMKAWSNYSGVHISEQGQNQFLFNFNKEEDDEDVMRKALWFLMNQLLCLEFWSLEIACEEITFNRSPFWIQIHNLPLENMNTTNATVLLNKVGEVMEVENPIHRGMLLRNFTRGRVKLDLDRPLLAGCWIPRKEMSSLWVTYKYMRLQSLCFNRGIVGHEQKTCQNPLAVAPYNPTKPKYGPNLSVGAPRSIHFLSQDPSYKPNFPSETEEEKKMKKHYY